MKVGNVEVKVSGSSLELVVHGCTGNYRITFRQSVADNYTALLWERDIYEALRRGRKDMQREVIDSLTRREGVPGLKWGKLRRAIDSVRSIYGL